MGFLAPITALVAASIVIPALMALYFLKLRRRQVVVASTLLWKKAIQDMQVNAPFQRLRKNLLLLLQLLLLAALLLAMARPTSQTTAAPGQRVILVIDHSASMNATDVSPTRLDEAKRTALELIDTVAGGLGARGGGAPGGGGGAMVVSFAQQARVVQPFTGDTSLLRQAVRSIQPTDQRSNLADALQLIQPFAVQAAEQTADDEQLVVYILSDGRVQRLPGEALTLRGADVRYLPQGRADRVNNVAIVSFSARRDFERPEIVQVFARLSNYGDREVTTNATLRIDGSINRVQEVRLRPAGDTGPGTRSLQFDFVLPTSGLVELTHDHRDDLAADDAARLMLAPARRLRVLMVSPGGSNAFLERVIRSVGVRDLVLMTPERYENQRPEALRRGGWDAAGTAAAAEGFDVIVFDGYSPQQPPPVNSVSFGSAPPIEGLRVVAPAADAGDADGGPRGAEVILDWRREHPILRHVVLDDVLIQRADRLVVPPEAVVLAVGQRGPIMAELISEGRRHMVVSFDVLRSNWPLYVSFPVFVSNAVQTLGLGALADEAGLAYTTGQVAAIPLDQPGAPLQYVGPVTLAGRTVGGQSVLPMFERVGVYRTQSGAVSPPFDVLPVNLLDAIESDLRPVDTLEVGTSVVQGQARTQAVRREVWHWFAWAALALLLVEWLVYTRRMHL